MQPQLFLLLWCAGLTVALGLVAFLLLGALRGLALVNWRIEQLVATTPRRIGRDGLPPGRRAPAFDLPAADGRRVALDHYAGRSLLLVFTQSGCGPCEQVMPELERAARDREFDVVVINKGSLDDARELSRGVGGRITVLAQEQLAVSKRYEVFATPFAFLVDERGVIVSKGIVANRQHIRFLLDEARSHRQIHAENDMQLESEPQPDAVLETSDELAAGKR